MGVEFKTTSANLHEGVGRLRDFGGGAEPGQARRRRCGVRLSPRGPARRKAQMSPRRSCRGSRSPPHRGTMSRARSYSRCRRRGNWMDTADAVLCRLMAQPGAFVSGQELAAELGKSRNAVWKAIEALRARGCDIEAKPRRGYRLLGAPDVPDEAAVLPGLRALEAAELGLETEAE